MAISNPLTESENAQHSSGTPVDPFAVDFFGGAQLIADENEAPRANDKPLPRRPKSRRKSDWYKNLPPLSNREAEFSNLLTSFPDNLTGNAAKIIAETLARYCSQAVEEVDCALISVAEVNLAQAIGKTNESANVFLNFAAEPDTAGAIGVINLDFAARLIDAVLDGQAEETRNRRELSPIEATIIEFLLAGMLGELNQFLGERVLVLQSVSDAPGAEFSPFERGTELVLNLKAGSLNGTLRFYAPPRFFKTLDRSENPLFARRAAVKKIRDFEKFVPQTALRLQIGKTFLDADSLLYLEREDIVLIEQPRIDLENGNFSGSAELFAGSGANFRLRGAVSSFAAAGNLNFRLEEITSEEARRRFTPAKYKMDVQENETAEETNFENDAPGSEEFAENFSDEPLSPALENVQVALRVEIAGNRISLRELQNLRAGQIIALGVSPTDPVRLVTDGSDEPVATGELVEIEGQLGVRLTKVFI